MKLLTINDSGVGDEIANIQVTREEVETLFMFAEDGLADADRRLERLEAGPTTQLAAQALQRNIEQYKYLRDMLDGLLKLWEIDELGDDGDELGVNA